MKKQYCSYCGTELVQGHAIIVRKVGKGEKQFTMLHLCDGHFKSLARKKFSAPYKLTKKMRTAPWYTITNSIIIAGKRRRNLLYTIPAWNLPAIREFDHSSPMQKLFDTEGNRVWTDEQVRATLHGNKNFVIHCAQLLYAQQTTDEKKDYKTKYANGNGFNQSDAKFGSAMAKLAFDKGNDSLSELQVVALERILNKYANQLAQLLYHEEVKVNEIKSK